MNSRPAQDVIHGLRLAWLMGRRDLRNRYASSIAGTAWLVGVPLLYSIINVFVFSILMSGKMGQRYGDVPFALFYFAGFSVWTVFVDVTSRSTTVMREYGYLINKIAFPVWIVPLIAFASALLTQLLILVITVAMMFWFNHLPSQSIWIYSLVWLCTMVLTIGVAYGIAAVAVFIPDMVQIVPVCVSIIFFLSPLLYPSTLVEQSAGPWARFVLMDLNPFYYLVEAARSALIGGTDFPWLFLGYAALFAGVSLTLGLFLFNRLRKGFADVV